ncbi:MAG: kelch repeat-containing protein, partial [Flavobacteriales bacterium]
RDDGSTFALDGKGYYGCGADINFKTTSDWWSYEAQFDSWEQVAAIPGRSRQYASAFASDEFGYLIGGILDAGSFSNQVFKYDPKTNSWEELEAAPFEGRAKATGFRLGDYYYFGTGISDSVILNDFWQFNWKSETWRQLDSLPFSPHFDMIAFSAKSKGYLLLGEDFVGKYQSVWQFDPISESWTQLMDYPGLARTYASAVAEPGGAVVAGGMDVSGNLLSESYHFDVGTLEWKRLPDLTLGKGRGLEGFRIGSSIYFVGGLTENFTRLNAVQRLRYNDERNAFDFEIWPIPARDELWISCELGLNRTLTIEIYGFNGQIETTLRLYNSSQLKNIDVRGLPNGLHLMKLYGDDLLVVKRFMVLN